MADFDWPVKLLPKRGSLQKTRRPNYEREEASVGSPKRKKLFSGSTESFSFIVDCDDADSLIFWNFYNNDLDYGGAAFNWAHPITDQVYEMIFEEEPSETDVSFNWNSISVKIREA